VVPDDDPGTHTGGRRKPRLFPKPQHLPILLPTISGTVHAVNTTDTCIAFGDVDPFNLLLDDEDLLLLV